MILKNQLVPGQKLIQEDLADRLGVSRTPLLAAFSKLEKELLVESRPRRGYYVKKLSLDEELNIFDIRLRLEPLGAGQAAGRARPADIRRLGRLTEEFIANPEASFNEYDYAFHNQIMLASGNDMLYRIVSSFNLISLSNQEGLVKDPATSVADHRLLIGALKRSDAESAEIIMLDHIRRGRERLAAHRGA